jgi:UDP-3-O-[3-hydroxymyristoyl] N-acetylglucosamine deacetylase
MRAHQQTTLAQITAMSGIGVHSGQPVTLKLKPADAGLGIVFQRVARDGSLIGEIPADVRSVVATEFATVVGTPQAGLLASAEHVMAALHALQVDNAVVEVDGPEIPIMDGSAHPIVLAIEAVGLNTLPAPRRHLEVLKTVKLRGQDGAYGELRPNPDGFRIETMIEFDHPLIGRQHYEADVSRETFISDIAPARTFGFMKDVARLWSAGYALGASFDNTLVFTDDRILNAEGLRFDNEPARHKALDAIGDLRLAGAPMLATYKSLRGGHKLNHAVLTSLMNDRSAWRLTPG